MTSPWIALVAGLWLAVLFLLATVVGLSQRLSALEAAAGTLPGSLAIGSGSVGPAIGQPLPDERAFARLSAVGSDTLPMVVLFLSAGCAPCLRLAEAVAEARLHRTAQGDFAGLRLVAVTDLSGQAQFAKAVDALVVDASGELAKSLNIQLTPFGVALDRGAIVRASTPLRSVEDILELRAMVSDDASASRSKSPRRPAASLDAR